MIGKVLDWLEKDAEDAEDIKDPNYKEKLRNDLVSYLEIFSLEFFDELIKNFERKRNTFQIDKIINRDKIELNKIFEERNRMISSKVVSGYKASLMLKKRILYIKKRNEILEKSTIYGL